MRFFSKKKSIGADEVLKLFSKKKSDTFHSFKVSKDVDSEKMWQEIKESCSESWCCKALKESIQVLGPLFISINSNKGVVTLTAAYCPACGRKL